MSISRGIKDTGISHGNFFDPDRRWRLHPSVAVRPEPFGALLYHFGTRQLSFLKDPRLVTVIASLGDGSTARTALADAGVSAGEHSAFNAALDRLASTEMIVAA